MSNTGFERGTLKSPSFEINLVNLQKIHLYLIVRDHSTIGEICGIVLFQYIVIFFLVRKG